MRYGDGAHRELGELLGVALRPHNRWNGFKVLRERRTAHLEHTLLRPVLLIDEALEMPPHPQSLPLESVGRDELRA